MSVIVGPNGNPVFSGGGGVAVPSSGKALITPSDFTYLGMFSVGLTYPGYVYWGYAEGGMTGRYVGGELRLLCLSAATAPPEWNNIPHIYEITPPADGLLTTTRATMPAATFVRDWGQVSDTQPYVSSEGNRTRGIAWDAALNGCWVGYAPKYGHDHNPSISYVVFNDTTNVGSRYGPWRTQIHGKLTGGYMCPIPSGFSATHCGGAPIALGCATLSLNASSAWGPIFIPTPRLETYATAPVDVIQDAAGQPINPPGGAHPRYTIPNPYPGMQYTYSNPHQRTDYTSVVVCAWGTHAANPDHLPLEPPYDPSHGAHIDAYPGPTFSSIMDWWASMAFIETPTKHGLCYFATIVAPVPGYPNPAHQWYGTKMCAHGINDIRHDPSSAGEGTTSKMNTLHVYDPADLADLLAGSITTAEIQGIMHNMYPTMFAAAEFQDAAGNDLFIGAFFDSVTNRLYLRERDGDSRGSAYWGPGDNDPKSAIHVFQVI